MAEALSEELVADLRAMNAQITASERKSEESNRRVATYLARAKAADVETSALEARIGAKLKRIGKGLAKQGASLAAIAITGEITGALPEDVQPIVSSAVSGAVIGAQLGGPVGAAIGALAFTLKGEAERLGKEIEAVGKSLAAFKASQKKEADEDRRKARTDMEELRSKQSLFENTVIPKLTLERGYELYELIAEEYR